MTVTVNEVYRVIGFKQITLKKVVTAGYVPPLSCIYVDRRMRYEGIIVMACELLNEFRQVTY